MTDESQFLVNTVPGSQYRFLSSCIPRCGAKKSALMINQDGSGM